MIVIDFPRNLLNQEQSKQVTAPAHPIKEITSRLPCSCKEGVCACCTGMLLQALRSKGCMNLKYIADDFAFIFEMKMNNQVLYKNRVSGKNPAPICVNPPRFPFIEVCATIYDVYFFGRNVHACMEFGGYFQGYELFSRNFDCLRMGAQGVRIVRPEEDVRPPKPGASSAGNASEAIVDAGDGIEDYDENLIRGEEQLTGDALAVPIDTTIKPVTVAAPVVPVVTVAKPVRKPAPPVKRPVKPTKAKKPVKNDSDDEDDDDDDDDDDDYFF